MEQKEPMTGFGTGPDWETFQRVWKRVMPDNTNSPIEVAKPPSPSPNRPRRETRPVQHPPAPASPPKEPEWDWMPLLRQLCEGVNAAGAMAQGGASPLWTMLHRQRQQALRQLGALYFLNTGKRYTCLPGKPGPRGNVSQMLRRQYLWEKEWAQLCADCAQRATEAELTNVCKTLAVQAMERRQKIRQALERMA